MIKKEAIQKSKEHPDIIIIEMLEFNFFPNDRILTNRRCVPYLTPTTFDRLHT